MIFRKEADFEEALIKVLTEKGWEKEEIEKFKHELEIEYNKALNAVV